MEHSDFETRPCLGAIHGHPPKCVCQPTQVDLLHPLTVAATGDRLVCHRWGDQKTRGQGTEPIGLAGGEAATGCVKSCEIHDQQWLMLCKGLSQKNSGCCWLTGTQPQPTFLIVSSLDSVDPREQEKTRPGSGAPMASVISCGIFIQARPKDLKDLPRRKSQESLTEILR